MRVPNSPARGAAGRASGSGSAARHASRVVQPQLDGTQGQPEELGYSGPHVCKIVGISYRQLDYWARTDLVRPSLADARGSGTQRRYPYRDPARPQVLKNLLGSGVKLPAPRKAIEDVRGGLRDAWASARPVPPR